MSEIDMVIPYVNNKDINWKKSFLEYASKHGYYGKMASMNGERYNNEIDLIYYQLQLITKNMPWIRTIHLLVCSKTQVIESLLPKNCTIVLHEQFIPRKYLPTFNSCTIEMFLWNIPNLSEKFIYANDDMLPLKELKPIDFFYNGRIKMNFNKETLNKESTQFKHQCYNSYNVTKNTSDCGIYGDDFVYPEHTFTPMILSDCKECFEMVKNKVLPQIRAFRNEKQHNQYIYPIFNYLYRGCYNSKIKFYYTHLNEPCVYFVKELYMCDIICVNATKGKENMIILGQYLESLCK